jgi:NTE family protein
MLSRIIGPFEVREKFRWIERAMLVAEDLQEDISFLRVMRRFLLPLPVVDRARELRRVEFPPRRKFEVPVLEGRKIGIVATGGSGAMMCCVGVVRACEEAGLEIAAISSCSGSALALAPIAAGLSAQETADFLAGWPAGRYLEMDWSDLGRLPFSQGRGFTGLADSSGIERIYEERFGRLAVGDLAVPFYANVWEADRNRLHYFGTHTRPEVELAPLVRAAVSLAAFVQPVNINGRLYGDGGMVNIFPVDPLVDHHPEIDFFIGVNAFYPENFEGEDVTGWQDENWSILRANKQVYTCQHIESARMQLRRIEDRCLLLHPLPYTEIKGIKLYELLLDRSRWPDFMERGYSHARAALEGLKRRDGCRP